MIFLLILRNCFTFKPDSGGRMNFAKVEIEIQICKLDSASSFCRFIWLCLNQKKGFILKLAESGLQIRICQLGHKFPPSRKGGRLAGKGVPVMLAAWMRFWLLPSRVLCGLLCPSLLLLLLLCCTLLLLVALSQVMWGPSRHLGSLTAANWVSFDFYVSYSSCWGDSLTNTLT